MLFQPGNFVEYCHPLTKVPYLAVVIKYIPQHSSYHVCPPELLGKTIEIHSRELKLQYLSIDKKLYILNSLGKYWYHKNKEVFKKALTLETY